MDKEAAAASEVDAQPPPYSAVAPPRVLHPHYHSQHHGYRPESVIQTPVVTQQPVATVQVVTTSPLFGPEPRTMICTACNQTVTSKVTRHRSIGVHICALCLFLVGCWPCILCIYCKDCSLRSNHYCPNCDAYQGTYIPDY